VEACPCGPPGAGIDIGSRTHRAGVGFTAEADSGLTREVPARTAGLTAVAAFLREHPVAAVARDRPASTGSPVRTAPGRGFEVPLVDPGYGHQLRDRPETDRRDCRWIDRLHSVGLLAAAFRPDEKPCQLPACLRQGANRVRQQSRHVQHMPTAPGQMSPKVAEVPGAVTGVTGRAVIRAILRGTRAPEKLAGHPDKGYTASEAEIAQALTGTYREEHPFGLELADAARQFALGQVRAVDGPIALHWGGRRGTGPGPRGSRGRSAGPTRPASTSGRRWTPWWGRIRRRSRGPAS
jgi:hypothetical protein